MMNIAVKHGYDGKGRIKEKGQSKVGKRKKVEIRGV